MVPSSPPPQSYQECIQTCKKIENAIDGMIEELRKEIERADKSYINALTQTALMIHANQESIKAFTQRRLEAERKSNDGTGENS